MPQILFTSARNSIKANHQTFLSGNFYIHLLKSMPSVASSTVAQLPLPTDSSYTPVDITTNYTDKNFFITSNPEFAGFGTNEEVLWYAICKKLGANPATSDPLVFASQIRNLNYSLSAPVAIGSPGLSLLGAPTTPALTVALDDFIFTADQTTQPIVPLPPVLGLFRMITTNNARNWSFNSALGYGFVQSYLGAVGVTNPSYVYSTDDNATIFSDNSSCTALDFYGASGNTAQGQKLVRLVGEVVIRYSTTGTGASCTFSIDTSFDVPQIAVPAQVSDDSYWQNAVTFNVPNATAATVQEVVLPINVPEFLRYVRFIYKKPSGNQQLYIHEIEFFSTPGAANPGMQVSCKVDNLLS